MIHFPTKSRHFLTPLLAVALPLMWVTSLLAQTAPSLATIGQATLDTSYAAWPSTGIAAGFQLPNGQTWLGAAGYTDLTHTTPLEPTDQFRVGSQSKTYTGTIILQMVSQGEISLNQTVAQLLPSLNLTNANQITVQELLNMTSGVPDYLNSPSVNTPGQTILQEWNVALGKTTSYTPQALVQQTNLLAPVNVPGAQMNYSNTNFVILGLIAQQVAQQTGTCPASGCSIGSLIQSNILTPLGLTNTVFTTNDQFTGTYAHGYLLGVDPNNPTSKSYTLTTTVNPANGGSTATGTAVDFSHVNPQVPWAAGAIISTPGDELKWINEITTNSAGLLSPAVQALRVTGIPGGTVASFPASYGLALYSQPNPLTGAPLLGHGGLITGYNSDIVEDTTSNIDFVANVSGFDEVNAPLAQAPAVVWMLSRNIDTATTATGNCTSGSNDTMAAGGSCTGVNVRTGSLTVAGGTITIAATGQTYAAYQPTFDGRGQVAAPAPVPSIASYGDNMVGLKLTNNAAAVIQPGALLTITGTNATAVALAGQGGSLTVAGGISTATVFNVQVGETANSLILPMTAAPGTLAVAFTGTGNSMMVTPTGTITGDVMIGGGGNTVAGTGTITGVLTNSAGNVVAPGTNGAGVLTAGTYVGNGGTLRIAIAPNGTAGLLSVTNTATLTGDQLLIQRAGGAPDTVQPVLLAMGGVTGTFAVAPVPGTSLSVAQGSTGTMIATVSPGLMDALADIAARSERLQRDAIATRLTGLIGNLTAGQTEDTSIAGGHATVWVSGIGGIGGGTSRNDSANYSTSGSGVVLGADGWVAPELVMGLSFSHFSADATLNDSGGEAQSASDTGGVYGGWFHGPFFLTANFIGGHGGDNLTREVNFLGMLSPQTGRFSDTRFGGGVNMGMTIGVQGFQLIPQLGLSYDHIRFDGFTEQGTAPLTVGAHTADTMRGEATLTAVHSLPVANGLWSASGHIGVAGDWSPGSGSTTATLAGFASPFALDVQPRTGALALVGAGVQYRAWPQVSMFLIYDGEYGGSATNSLFSGGVRIVF
jgi:CubicO group peptidase (beta-lactamase class C family)/uncharacterized protein with beta-barrel porin domain